MDRRLGRPLPHQLANPPQAPPEAPFGFDSEDIRPGVSCGIRLPFESLFLTRGEITHVLLTRPPLFPGIATRKSLDLHVLGTPPAFTLSQDQTLQL